MPIGSIFNCIWLQYPSMNIVFDRAQSHNWLEQYALSTHFPNSPILSPDVFRSSTHYGEGSGPLWLDFVECSGDEESIFDCGNLGIGQSLVCGDHTKDVGVVCEGACRKSKWRNLIGS